MSYESKETLSTGGCMRAIEMHGQEVKARVLSARKDLWGITVHVITDELGPMVSSMRDNDADHLQAGDAIIVRVYCTNLMMSPLFEVVK